MPVNQITLTGTKQGAGHCWTEWSLSSSSNSLCVDYYFPCEKHWPKVNEGDFSLLRDVETEASRGSLAPESHTGEEKRQDSDHHFCTQRWIPKPLQPSSSFPWPSSSQAQPRGIFYPSLSHSVTKFPPFLSSQNLPWPPLPTPTLANPVCRLLSGILDRLLPLWPRLTPLLEVQFLHHPLAQNHPLPIKCQSQHLITIQPTWPLLPLPHITPHPLSIPPWLHTLPTHRTLK